MRNLFTKAKAVLLVCAALFSANLAFAETGTETEADQQNGNKNTTAEGQSYFIDGTYIAGTGSASAPPMTSKGLKFRTGQNGGTLEFTVREGYTVTRLYMAAVGNYDKTDASIDQFINVTKVEADGVEVPFTGLRTLPPRRRSCSPSTTAMPPARRSTHRGPSTGSVPMPLSPPSP